MCFRHDICIYLTTVNLQFTVYNHSRLERSDIAGSDVFLKTGVSQEKRKNEVAFA